MRQRNDGVFKRCECPRRGWAKCPHSWQFAYKWQGTRYRVSLDRTLGRHVDSKTEAERESEELRLSIREGRFGQPSPREHVNLRGLTDIYLERYVEVTRKATVEYFKTAIRTINRTMIPRTAGEAMPFGEWRVSDITTDTVERFREVRLRQGVSPAGVNRNLQSLRALFNWAVRAGYVESTPFTRHSLSVVRISKADEAPRARRLNADTDEERRLLDACGPHLRAVVECALETGMRRGEILSLQWHQIEGLTVEPAREVDVPATVTWAARAEIVLPWVKTKTKRDRRIPVSSRLRAVLELRRLAPDGEPHPHDAYVFGNEIGQRVRDVGRAWETAVLRAHGHPPKFSKTCNLTPECRAALRAIDLHLHDLRREAGSRWLEGGVPIHVVRDWLGHTSIAQTSTYLAGTLRVQHDAMAAFEARRRDVALCGTDSETGGRKSPRSALVSNEKPSKTTVRHEPGIM